tara:strand:- start:219 stop:473 length:255 start_codon:yes stop_codon:yes gene_type:complete
MYNVNEIKLTPEEEELALDDTWGCLFGHTRKIHGNENRIRDKVKVKIVDRNGAIIGVSERVRFKQEKDSKTKRYIDTWLEVKVR